MLAVVLHLIDKEIPLKVTLIIASVLSVVAWVTSFVKFERGKTVDGTIGRQWTEEATESVVVPDEKDFLGRRVFEDRTVTLYKTEVKWDNGKTEVMSIHNCAADHIQLKEGDRVRKYLSTGEFIKLDLTKRK